MKVLRSSFVALLLLAGLATVAKAYPTAYEINLTFLNGATFSGVVDFNSSLTEVTSLTGTLSDYQDGTLGFKGSGSDTISTLLSDGTDIGKSVDGVNAGDAAWMVNIGTKKHPDEVPEENVLTLDFNTSNPNDISLIDVLLQTGVDHTLGGTIIPCGSSFEPEVAATPEPGSILLLGTGLVAMAGFAKRKFGMRA